MRKHKLFILLLWTLIVVGLAACSGTENSSNDTIADPDSEDEELEPVTIRIMSRGPFNDDERFQEYYVEPLAKVYPHITLERVPGGIGDLEDMILAQETPDIIAPWNGDFALLMGMELMQDLHPYVEELGSDLERFEPETLDSATINGALYGLPYAQQFEALYYNKDIFDLFGVPYPKDGMTWNDTIELATVVSREESGTNYRGLHPHMFARLLNPFGLGSFADFETNESIVSARKDDLKVALETWDAIAKIPGNLPEDINDLNNMDYGEQEFFEGTLAMLPAVNIINYLPEELNWGVVQYPQFEQVPNTYGAIDAHYHVLTTVSQNPTDAFRVMDFFASPEFQERMTRELGLFTVMKDPEIKTAFASENPIISEMDFSGVFKSTAAESPILHEIRLELRGIAGAKAVQMIEDGRDVNTIISEIEQEVDVAIKEYESRQ